MLINFFGKASLTAVYGGKAATGYSGGPPIN